MLPHPPGEVLGDEDAGAPQQLRLPQHSLLVLDCKCDDANKNINSGCFAIIFTNFKLGHCISASPCSCLVVVISAALFLQSNIYTEFCLRPLLLLSPPSYKLQVPVLNNEAGRRAANCKTLAPRQMVAAM